VAADRRRLLLLTHLREEIVKIISGLAAISLVAVSSLFRPILAEAAEIKLLCAVAMKPAVDELAPAFERLAAHKLIVTYGTAGGLRDKIRTGEAFDAAVLPTPFMDPLVTQGAVVSGSVTVVVRSLISVGVRAGSPKPDISTVAAFKNAMLGAKSISYADPSQGGGSGIQVARVLEALGISEIMKPKTKLVPGAESVDLVAAGEAEFALGNTPVFVAKPGVELVGPIPTDLYDTKDFVFKIGIGANAKESGAARGLIEYLLSPEASAYGRRKVSSLGQGSAAGRLLNECFSVAMHESGIGTKRRF
jgi:molybdate transport system substrate-binding protein